MILSQCDSNRMSNSQLSSPRVQELPSFVVGRKISVITSVNGVTTARVPSVIVKDEAVDLNSDGASIGSNVSSNNLTYFCYICNYYVRFLTGEKYSFLIT